jgi:hypothetical protein
MMSTTVSNEFPGLAQNAGAAKLQQPAITTPWKALCAWLTRDLRGMEASIERRDKNGEWAVECMSSPLESVTTHWTGNGVQVISIKVRMNGKPGLFEVTGPNLLEVRRNAAGWPIKVELGFEEGRLALLFSGQLEPQRWASRNAWGE